MTRPADLGTIHVSAFASKASFTRATRDVPRVAPLVAHLPARLSDGRVHVRVSRLEPPASGTLALEVEGLPRFRALDLRLSIEASGEGTATLRVHRTLSLLSLELGLAPLLLLFRHMVPIVGAVVAALAIVAPFAVRPLRERLPALEKVRVPWAAGACWIVVCVATYGVLLHGRFFRATISQDDDCAIGGEPQAKGTIEFHVASDLAVAKGCAWTNGSRERCFSSKPPLLTVAESTLDRIDDGLGTPLTRFRCHTDAATLEGVSEDGQTCLPAAHVDLSASSSSIGPCAVEVRRASEGTCSLTRDALDAWVAFPSFLARARPKRSSPDGRPALLCRDDEAPPRCTAFAGAGADAFTTLAWSEPLAVEVDDLCPRPEDSICAVRSKTGARAIEHLSLPTNTPVHVVARLQGGQLAQGVCTLLEPVPVGLSLEVVAGATWIRSVRVTQGGVAAVECSPVVDASRSLLLLRPVGDPSGTSVHVEAAGPPSSGTVLAFGAELSVDLNADSSRRWITRASGRSLQFARLATVERCPRDAGGHLALKTTEQRVVEASDATGRADSLFIASTSRDEGGVLPGVAAAGRPCGLLPATPATLPDRVDCARVPFIDGFGHAHEDRLEAAPWCAP